MSDEAKLKRLYALYKQAGNEEGQLNVLRRLKSMRTETQQPAQAQPAAQPPQQLQNPFMGRSTDELIALSEQPGITPEQRNQIMDAASANELDTGRDASPEAVREFQQRKGEEFSGAAVGGLKQGFRRFGAGVEQFGRQLAEVSPVVRGAEAVAGKQLFRRAEEVAPERTAELQAREAELRQQYPDQQGVITGSMLFGEAAPLAAVPMGTVNTLRQLAIQGAKYGALGGATQFSEEGTLAERAQKIGIGATVGAAVPVVAAGAGKVGLKSAGLVNFKSKGDEAQAIHDFAKQEGVSLAFTDTTKNMVARRVDQALEKLGVFGTAGFRRKQQGELLESAKRYLDDLRPTRDAPLIIQESINNTATTFQQRAGAVFEDVFRRADQAGGAVKMLNSRNAAKELIENEVVKKQFADAGLIDEMNKVAQGGNFDMRTAHRIRSDMLDMARAARGDNLTPTKLSRAYEQVAKAMDYDIGRYAVNKDLHRDWRLANRYFKEKVVPMRDTMITKSGKTDMPDEILSKFIRTDGVTGSDRALKLYNAMDTAGRDAAKYLLVERAFEKAVSDIPTGQAISPAKFASELERLQKATGIFFKGQDKARMEGFKKMMMAANRAGAFTAMPENGASLFFPGIVAAVSAVSPITAGAWASAATGAKLLFTTEAGKRLLMSAAKVKYDSPQMEALVRAMATLGAAENATEEQ